MARCFVVMPISVPELWADTYNDSEHFKHVLDHLFTPALEAVGYEVVPPAVAGSDIIHAEIISNLETCDMVLCDISTSNPNVFFELGIRTSLDRPAALVRDALTTMIPFDTNSINTHKYDAFLRAWNLAAEIDALSQHIEATAARADGRNSLWRYFGITRRATPAEIGDPTQAKLDLIVDEMGNLSSAMRALTKPPASTPLPDSPQLRYLQHEANVAEAIRSFGYDVSLAGEMRGGFDFLIKGAKGEVVAAEVKDYSRPLAAADIQPIIARAEKVQVPVLIISSGELSHSALEACSQANIRVVRWSKNSDNSGLSAALDSMIASISTSSADSTDK